MAEEFSQKKILQYLSAALSLAAAGILIKEIFFSSRPAVLEPIDIMFPQVTIDFNLLESAKVKELFLFEQIVKPETVGRENPFLPF